MSTSGENIHDATDPRTISGNTGRNDDQVRDVQEGVKDRVRDAAHTAQERVRDAAHTAQERLRDAQARMRDASGRVAERGREALHRVNSTSMSDVEHALDTYVRENPGKSLAIAAGVGMVVGLMLGSRR